VLLVAWIATIGDYIWYEAGVRHRVVAGILHGAALLAAAGGALGWAAGRTAAGLPIGTAAGVGGALSYYALQPVVGRAAMPAAWGALWILLALLAGKWLYAGARSPGEMALRGVLAAALGGAAFWLVVGALWGPAPGGRNYVRQLLLWAVAWAPGLLALGLDRPAHAMRRG
jgi:hypothetical protein